MKNRVAENTEDHIYSFHTRVLDELGEISSVEKSQIVRCISGQAVIESKGIESEFTINSYLILPPFRIIRMAEISEALTLEVVSYDLNFINLFLKGSHNPLAKGYQFLNELQSTLPLSVENPKKDSDKYQLMDTFESIKTEIIKPHDQFTRVLLTSRVIEFIITYLRIHEEKKTVVVQPDEKSTSMASQREYSHLILEYIEKNLDKKLTVTRVASDLFVCESTLKKMLREYFNAGLPDIVNQMRCKKAQELLLTADLPVGRIAGKLGYSSASYFCMKFKELHGLTPQRYRREHETDRRVLTDKDVSMSSDFLQFINENYGMGAAELRLQLADRNEISNVEINKMLSYLVEQNLNRYVHGLRIKKACRLLLQTDKTIGDIAYECGYKSLVSFNSNFLKMMSLPPSQYRTIRVLV